MERVMERALRKWKVDHVHAWSQREKLPFFKEKKIINKNSKIVTIGSCFATEIVNYMKIMGLNCEKHPAGQFYNTYNICYEIEKCFLPEKEKPQSYYHFEGRWYLYSNYKVSKETEREIKEFDRGVQDQFAKLIKEADVIVITLGLTEVWRLKESGQIFNQTPQPKIVNSGSAEFFCAPFAKNLSNMDRTVKLLKENTRAEVIVTVSPVPLFATFTDQDITIANNISKSTLRAVAAELVKKHPETHYFQSYELVMGNNPNDFFMEDGRHVKKEGVAVIMDQFYKMFCDESLQDRRELTLSNFSEPLKGSYKRSDLTKIDRLKLRIKTKVMNELLSFSWKMYRKLEKQ